MTYVYKVTKKLLNEELLPKVFPICDEGGTYAKNIMLDANSGLVKGMIGLLNNRKWQENAGVFDDEQRAELAKQGLEFEEVWVDSDDGKARVMEGYEVVVTDELIEEFKPGLLMFDKEGEYKNMLYVGSASETYPFVYFSSEIIKEHCPEIIKDMLREGLIRKVKLEPKKASN